jgi:hypothetical protein
MDPKLSVAAFDSQIGIGTVVAQSGDLRTSVVASVRDHPILLTLVVNRCSRMSLQRS